MPKTIEEEPSITIKDENGSPLKKNFNSKDKEIVALIEKIEIFVY